jgi:AGCS family alanine or glycine:cation symporter
MQAFEKFVGQLSDFVWGPPLLILLLGTHIFLTFRLRFIQRYLGKAIKLSVQKSPEGRGDISPFGALTTALAATIGTGNIVGVATAVAAGGPGDSKPYFANCAQWRHRFRNTSLPMEQQFRCGGARATSVFY